jgi:hypothetical protein
LSATGPLVGRMHGHPPFPVQAEVRSFSPVERRRRALLVAAPLAAIGLVLLPFPGLHLTSPILLCAAFVLARRRLREVERIESLVGACPCGALDRPYALPERIEWPLTLRCPACREFVKVETA